MMTYLSESAEGIVAAIVMLLAATVIMSAFYGVPYLIWKGFNRLMKIWDRRSIRKAARWRSSTKPQEGHEALRAAIRKQGES